MLIEDYLSENVYGFTGRNDGEAVGECPMCGKEKGHFYIHIGNDERKGRWICFSCQEKGDLWRLIGHLEGMSATAAKAWWMRQQKEAPPTSVDKVRSRLDALRNRGVSLPSIDTALPYGFKRIKRRRPKILADRGVTLRTAREYGLGYCSEGDYAGRVVFPVICPLGRSWTARAVGSMRPKYWGGDGAGRLLYGWDVAFRIGAPSELVICEGPMDVLSLYQAGISAVAVMSKTINETRAALLRRTGARLLVALDAEALTEALEVSEALNNADVVQLTSGDPGDTPPDILIQSVSGALQRVDAMRATFRDRVKKMRRKRVNGVVL